MELEESINSTPIIERGLKSENVVVLDDEEPNGKRARKTVEIIDLIPSSLNTKCVNYACKSGTDLVSAPGFCLSYYRVKNTNNVRLRNKEVCRECFNIASEEYEMLISQLKLGKLLCDIDLPLRNDTFEIDDSDEDDEHEEKNDLVVFEGENFEFIKEHFERILTETMKAVNFETHVDNEIALMGKKKSHIDDTLDGLSATLKKTRTALDNIQKDLYNEFRSKTLEQTVLTIIDDASLFLPLIQVEKPSNQQKDIKMKDEKEEQMKRKSLRSAKRVSYTEKEDGKNLDVKIADKDDEVQIPNDLPQIGKLQKPQLILNDIYYITRENITNGSWIKARFKGIELYMDFEGKFQYKFQELKQLHKRIVNGKQLAYFQFSKTRFDVGTRVIAVFKNIGDNFTNITNDNRLRHELYYPGIVAEPPVEQNRYRYLIFFDIGYSQYVDYKKVNQIYEASARVWEDIPINSRSFIKKYLESTDRPMVKLQKDEKVRVEYNGKWLQCTIKQIDCSLVLVSFDHVIRLEWIYRGSTRLKPMYKEEQNATKRHTGGRTCGKTQSTQQIVQYTKNCDFEKKIDNVRAVARKSTTVKNVPPINNVGIIEGPNIVRFLPQLNNSIAPPIEPTSKIMYFTPRDQIITQRLYRPHTCSTACKDYVRHNSNKLRAHNPLSKPLLCGWARITLRIKGRREIVYKAPCSRMLRNMEEIHQYLRMTKSDMTVDLFDFNVSVRCLAEFNVECEPNPKDLSNGLENVPIPVINGIDGDILDFCNYATKRVPMEEVQLNTDPAFLCGCDCEDDCVDKTKCSCWKLTLEGAKYMGKNVDPDSIGYVYRRLLEQVLTGIYECNSRCKCASTCLNRVVQNPMSLKLQVFKTHNRGWGIRCVNDVPQGTFICIYAGTIHTEQMANQDGQTYGDEYFAELDYIENCERHKEDYEADVVEPDDNYTNSSINKKESDGKVKKRSSKEEPDENDDDEEEEEEEEEEYVFGGRRKKEDTDFVPFGVGNQNMESWMKLRKRTDVKNVKKEMKNSNNSKLKGKKEDDNTTSGIKDETIMISDDEDDPKEVLNFNPSTVSDLDESKAIFPSVRSFFGEDEPYIMDTKNAGNIGRFLNHSCSPNVFVQNVFVDTHDVRFPWVAFFCQQFIRAGTELTWNYNYDIGSVPGRVLYCQCGSLECKGRML